MDYVRQINGSFVRQIRKVIRKRGLASGIGAGSGIPLPETDGQPGVTWVGMSEAFGVNSWRLQNQLFFFGTAVRRAIAWSLSDW